MRKKWTKEILRMAERAKREIPKGKLIKLNPNLLK